MLEHCDDLPPKKLANHKSDAEKATACARFNRPDQYPIFELKLSLPITRPAAFTIRKPRGALCHLNLFQFIVHMTANKAAKIQ